jgi:hypothetical protein
MNNPGPFIQVRTNREFNAGMIHDCLTVISSLTGCLRIAAGNENTFTEDGSMTKAAPELDGGARLALEASLSRACKRLDDLLNDNARWEEPRYDAHDSSMKYFQQQIQINQINLHSAQAQLAALEERLKNENDILREGMLAGLRQSLEDIKAAQSAAKDLPGNKTNPEKQ